MYTYAQAETVLARMYGADETVQRAAFRGRLKHLKRLGIPLNSSPGSGRKVLYERSSLSQWALCLELEEFGLDPTLIAEFVKLFWGGFATSFQSAEDETDDVIWVLNPAVMSRTWRAPQGSFQEKFPSFLSMNVLQLSDPGLMDRFFEIGSRAAIVNLSEVVRRLRSETNRIGMEW